MSEYETGPLWPGGSPSIPLDDPALREFIRAVQLHFVANSPASRDNARSALAALLTAYPSLASPKTGAE